ncbi:MAG: tetratricopeptide repeat protein [Cyclobacteriaceae bacterium]
MKAFFSVGILCALAFFVGCSLEQTSLTGNAYHNVTAHFNSYYYAKEIIKEVEETILGSLDDDHNQILRLSPKLDTILAKSYSKDTEEAIKMASISIQRHPNSKWVDDSYLMVGLARLYSCDYQNAIQTFKYVNTKSTNNNTRHEALIYLARTFIENEEFEKAEEVFLFLAKEDLNKNNAKKLYLLKAYHYQTLEDYNNMVYNLTQADTLLSNSDEKGRIYFIVGQVYQKLGFGSEAYNYYRKCIATNPAYEIDFYARLNLAQVARLDDVRDVKTVRNTFAKMLDDSKNAEFRDKIYYELAEFERKQGHLEEAIENYKYAAHAGLSKRIQGSSYLRLGQIHFDSLKKYSLAKNYYDSAVTSLPPDFEDYASIKKRQEILEEFVKYTETIAWQDSLLYMASLDSLELRSQLDSTMADRKRLAEVENNKKKRRRAQSGGGNNQNNPFFLDDSNATNDWYFGNLSAVSLGQSEFQRIWGRITLEDNWRRSNKSTINELEETTIASREMTDSESETSAADEGANEVNQIFSQLPLTDEAKEKSLAQIEDAYFNLGDIYFLKLGEKQNATDTYHTLLNRFPTTELKPEVLYKLYLISNETRDGKADSYYQDLVNNHPNSNFTKILLNPDYLKETSIVTEKQERIYKVAYEHYENGHTKDAQIKLNEAKALGETWFTPQLDLLNILITGKTEDINQYKLELNAFIEKYPDDPLKSYAEKLLASSNDLQEKLEKGRSIRYAKSTDEPHFFIISHLQQNKISDLLSKKLDEFIQQEYRGSKLATSTLIMNEIYALTIVSEFPDQLKATEFFDKFTEQSTTDNTLSNYKINIFVITKNNSDILYRTKALDEYLTFFDRNYKVKNQ